MPRLRSIIPFCFLKMQKVAYVLFSKKGSCSVYKTEKYEVGYFYKNISNF
ncbi:hypothetical protein SAMN05216323_108411 [Williamwhitmania taraxaci]|uniref:Uncharacterized protein n=1 Tax=Williamwhitmania taraxaci TaxID=1640674 RepID=A0A1G6S051_9BACT|nr:hypothetical protein SAMN05216323_108411 [Williamwhitmania taraxaci]